MLQAVWVQAVTVSFDGDDFAEDLIGFNRLIEGTRRIAAKDKEAFFG